MRSTLLTVALAAISLAGSSARAADWKIVSPNGKVVATVRLDGEGDASKLTLAVACDGLPVLDPSPLGIVRNDAAFDGKLHLDSAGEVTSHDSEVSLLHGKARQVRDHYTQQVLTFENTKGQKLALCVRAYDDGVAFRYLFPETDVRPHTVTAEMTGFQLPAGSVVWAQPYDEPTVYTPAYESYFQFAVPAGTPSETAQGWAFPMLFRTPAGRYGLITDAALDGTYCGVRFAQESPGGLYRLRFPDPSEGLGTGPVEPSSPLPWATPWRVVVVGDTPSPIVETNLIELLNPPSRIADTSWIKPGRVSWSWLFDADSPQDATKLKKWIDLAAEMGWEYSLIDANWDIMANGTIHDLLAYAKSKKVGLILWYNSGGPHNAVTERPRGMMDQERVRKYEFERLAKWGVKGVKVDFFQSDKQNVLGLYEGILKDAAEHHILVDFHGCTLPRGWSRTWPNLMSMEAVRGAENYQFNPKFPAYAPAHNALLPFTRNAVGPMDYTPVIFRDNKNPMVTTPGHEIALPVVFVSALLHFGGGPEEYLTLPEVPKTFLKNVPVVWDETPRPRGRWLTGR
jgi:hypothetical protein